MSFLCPPAGGAGDPSLLIIRYFDSAWNHQIPGGRSGCDFRRTATLGCPALSQQGKSGQPRVAVLRNLARHCVLRRSDVSWRTARNSKSKFPL